MPPNFGLILSKVSPFTSKLLYGHPEFFIRLFASRLRGDLKLDFLNLDAGLLVGLTLGKKILTKISMSAGLTFIYGFATSSCSKVNLDLCAEWAHSYLQGLQNNLNNYNKNIVMCKL